MVAQLLSCCWAYDVCLSVQYLGKARSRDLSYLNPCVAKDIEGPLPFCHAIDYRTLSARADMWNATKIDKCPENAQAAPLLEEASGCDDPFDGQL